MKLNNALIYDGSGSLPYRASIETTGSVISRIQSQGFDDGLDLNGLVVCPGFMDMHAHSEALSLRDPGMSIRAVQGITFDLSGNCGAGLWPRRPGQQRYEDILGPSQGDWKDFASYASQSKASINQAFLQAHGPLRLFCLENNPNREATEAEIRSMAEILETSMDDGCLGLSTGLYYAPCLFASRAEMLALLRTVARKGGIFSVHHRCEGSSIFQSLDEILSIAREAECRTEVSHLKVIGLRNQGLVEKVLEKIESYGATFDQYTYDFGSTSLESLLPPFLLGLPKAQRMEALQDPQVRNKARLQMLHPEGWDSLVDLCSWQNIRILQLPTFAELESMSLAEVAEKFSKDPFDCLFDILSKEKGASLMTDTTQTDESLRTIMRHPLGVWGTDALYTAGPMHPRSSQATFHLFRSFYLDKPVMSLEALIHRMTAKTAQRLGIRDRGLVKEGFKADLCVLDLDHMDEEKREGIPLVLVNGRPIVSRFSSVIEEKAFFPPVLNA